MPGPMTCLPSLHISLLTSERVCSTEFFTSDFIVGEGILVLTFSCFLLLGTPNELPPPPAYISFIALPSFAFVTLD